MKNNNIEKINEIEIIKEEKPNLFKKIFIIILGIFLIILAITYLSSNSLVNNILIGLIQSNKVENSIVNINSTNKLIFLNDSYEKLLKIYDNNSEREFKTCFKGKIDKGDYIIKEIYIPKTYSQTSNEVVSEFCSNDTIVDMHSHPLKHCIPSEQDFKSFKLFKEKSNNAIMAVMCERERFNFYI